MLWKTLGLLILNFTNVFCEHWPPNVAENLSDGDSFDFIVVGSGSGGSPVATRLAQRGQNVLLLEAGGQPTLNNVIPGMCTSLPMSDVDWQFISEYDESVCKSLLNKRCRKPRGNVLGGCSSINFMIYVRGNKRDYDDWNIPSWTYDKMFPYFLRMESLTNYHDLPPELKLYHNDTGPLKVSLLNASMVEWRDHLINAYQEIGLKRNWDINGPSQIGITVTHATVFNGERQSTAEAYLVPNSGNYNLNVAYNSFVTKIIIDENNVVKGVRVSIEDNEEITIKAKKEVILSAGTIKTPQLLMLSGIGPASELRKYGIRLRVNNQNVGQNLQDHPQTPIIVTANTDSAIPVPKNSAQILLDQWLNDRSGLLATIGLSDISAFVDTVDGGSVPDIQILHMFFARNDSFSSSIVLEKALGFNEKVRNYIKDLNKESEIILFALTLIRPGSRGGIHLASDNPYDHPLIYGNTFVEPEDHATYMRGIRLFEKLLTTKTLIKNDAKLAKINALSECNGYVFQSDDYWLCYRNNLADTIFHPVGTASIGLVVDERLCVYGVRRLRVADASAMPLVPRGNINAATIALGERAADFILQDHAI